MGKPVRNSGYCSHTAVSGLVMYACLTNRYDVQLQQRQSQRELQLPLRPVGQLEVAAETNRELCAEGLFVHLEARLRLHDYEGGVHLGVK